MALYNGTSSDSRLRTGVWAGWWGWSSDCAVEASTNEETVDLSARAGRLTCVRSALVSLKPQLRSNWALSRNGPGLIPELVPGLS